MTLTVETPKQRCPKCGRLVRVRRNGNLFAHLMPPDPWTGCEIRCPYPQDQYSPREA